MSRNFAGIGDSKLLQRKIPQSSKYRNIEARVDTGSSISRYDKRIEEIQANYRYRKNELFKRMKVTTFAQLVLQVANVSMQDDASVSDLPSARSEAPSVATLNGNYNESEETPRGDDGDSPRSTLHGVISGFGEIDLQSSRGKVKEQRPLTPDMSKQYQDCPFLLLDVRDRDDYEKSHVTGAINFPIAMLSRTMNNFTREILEFKNSQGRIIILYDEDERISTKAATTMVERGFDNIFIISGGLKVIGQKIPEGLVNGALPKSCVPPYILKRMQNNRASRGSVSPLEQIAILNKRRFSSDDLDKITHYLDESLIPSDTGSRLSRLSKASYRSNGSKASSVASSDIGGGERRPWK